MCVLLTRLRAQFFTSLQLHKYGQGCRKLARIENSKPPAILWNHFLSELGMSHKYFDSERTNVFTANGTGNFSYTAVRRTHTARQQAPLFDSEIFQTFELCDLWVRKADVSYVTCGVSSSFVCRLDCNSVSVLLFPTCHYNNQGIRSGLMTTDWLVYTFDVYVIRIRFRCFWEERCNHPKTVRCTRVLFATSYTLNPPTWNWVAYDSSRRQQRTTDFPDADSFKIGHHLWNSYEHLETRSRMSTRCQIYFERGRTLG